MLKKKLLLYLKYIFLLLVAFVALTPFIILFLTSIKNPIDALSTPPKWFFIPTLANYIAHLSKISVLASLKNSFIIGVSSTFISLVLGIITGYTVARFKFRGKNLISNSLIYLRIIPPIAFVMPYFLIWGRIGLADTFFAIIIMYVIITLPLITWMMYSFFQEVPIALEEAAFVDGCNRWQALRFILIPAVTPGIFAAASLAFIFVWNEFLFALFITGNVTRTIPIEIYSSMGYYLLDWSKMSSLAVISIIPSIIFIALTQKYIIRGLTMGAVKE